MSSANEFITCKIIQVSSTIKLIQPSSPPHFFAWCIQVCIFWTFSRQHHQLGRDRPLPVRHGSHDPLENLAPGHRTVQPSGYVGKKIISRFLAHLDRQFKSPRPLGLSELCFIISGIIMIDRPNPCSMSSLLVNVKSGLRNNFIASLLFFFLYFFRCSGADSVLNLLLTCLFIGSRSQRIVGFILVFYLSILLENVKVCVNPCENECIT